MDTAAEMWKMTPDLSGGGRCFNKTPMSLSLYIATRNAHKLDEIRKIAGGAYHVLGFDALEGVPEVVEDRPTIPQNAIKKAVEISQWLENHAPETLTADYVLADDTGLEVDALDGKPGVYSARFAVDEKKPDESLYEANNRKLLRELAQRGVKGKERSARFRCVMALASGGKLVQTFEGICEGIIINECKGGGGFGYDPLFVPKGYCESFSQLGDEVKNSISHRARALGKLKEYLISVIDRCG